MFFDKTYGELKIYIFGIAIRVKIFYTFTIIYEFTVKTKKEKEK